MLVFRAGCADGAVVIVVSVGNEDNGDDKLEFLYSNADEKFSLSPISDEWVSNRDLRYQRFAEWVKTGRRKMRKSRKSRIKSMIRYEWKSKRQTMNGKRPPPLEPEMMVLLWESWVRVEMREWYLIASVNGRGIFTLCASEITQPHPPDAQMKDKYSLSLCSLLSWARAGCARKHGENQIRKEVEFRSYWKWVERQRLKSVCMCSFIHMIAASRSYQQWQFVMLSS